jgi:alpha-beta hydrolase superfamily lysophospholipase
MLQWKSDGSARVFVVCIHGLGLCARAYKPLAEEFAHAGIDGCAINVRGFGPDRADRSYSKLDLVKTSADLKALLLAVRRSYPEYRICLLGESMGGALSVRVTADNPDLVDCLLLSAPAWKILKLKRTAVKGVFEALLTYGTSPGPAGRSVIRQATSDRELTEHLLSDPSHKLRLSAAEAASFLSFTSKTNKAAREVTCPVLFVQGLNDRLVNPRAVARLFSVVPAQEKEFIIDAQGEHLLLEEGQTSRPLLEALMQWLKRPAVAADKPRIVFLIVNDSTADADKKRLEHLRRLCGG